MQLMSELIKEIKGLSPLKAKEVYDFVRFIKARGRIDPDQVYFRTKRRQENEKAADSDGKAGRTVGNGTARDLVSNLKK